MNFKHILVPFYILIILLSACTGGTKKSSSTTGWEYNNPENGGIFYAEQTEQETGPGLVFIEGGTFVMGRTYDDVLYDWNNIPRRVTVSSFYMDETEIRNIDYREYLHWLSRVYIDYPQVHRNALPDTLVWRTPLGYNEPYVETYFRHPAYNEYPVVGVNWLQASDYCLWRTDRVNEMLLIREGILLHDPNQINEENFNTDAYLAGQYEGLVNQNLPDLDPNKEERPVKFEDGILLPKYRLPSEAEWEFAALSLIGNSYDERIYNKRMYPWDGHNLRNPKGSDMGRMLANYKRGRGDNMGVSGALNDNAEIPAPVDSYWPNDYGLYCMAGNVSEWVFDVYRPLSFQDFDDFRPVRGNVFTTKERDEDGNLVEKDSLGRIKYREITEEEAIGRRNYHKSNYINYKDGDWQSSLNFIDEGADKGPGSGRMYGETAGSLTSLVTDRSRVYKGGSWNDRAYWMSPGTRRFLDERQSSAEIGFRCAMNRIGSPGGF